MAKGFVSNAAVKSWCKANEYRLSQDVLPAINARVVEILEDAATKCAKAKRKTLKAEDFEDEAKETTM